MQNIQNIDSLNDFENEEVKTQELGLDTKLLRYKSKQLFLTIQIVVSLLVLISIGTLKFLNVGYFNQIKSWYNEKINDSLIAGNDVENYRDVLNNLDNIGKNNTIKKYKKKLTNNNINLSVPLSKPLESGTITSHFGERIDPITRENKSHHGLDIGAPKGQAILCVLPGTVVKTDRSTSYGNCVVVDHGNNIQTLYAHCDKITVNTGTQVNRGQELAMVGNSGRSTGNHLHFELVINGTPCNPENFFEGNYI